MWIIQSDELRHHGVKGQKWGVRRYQNYDGTYTVAGKSRYSTAQKTVPDFYKGFKTVNSFGSNMLVGTTKIGGHDNVRLEMYTDDFDTRKPYSQKELSAYKNQISRFCNDLGKRDSQIRKAFSDEFYKEWGKNSGISESEFQKSLHMTNIGVDQDSDKRLRAEVWYTEKPSGRQGTLLGGVLGGHDAVAIMDVKSGEIKTLTLQG